MAEQGADKEGVYFNQEKGVCAGRVRRLLVNRAEVHVVEVKTIVQ